MLFFPPPLPYLILTDQPCEPWARTFQLPSSSQLLSRFCSSSTTGLCTTWSLAPLLSSAPGSDDPDEHRRHLQSAPRQVFDTKYEQNLFLVHVHQGSIMRAERVFWIAEPQPALGLCLTKRLHGSLCQVHVCFSNMTGGEICLFLNTILDPGWVFCSCYISVRNLFIWSTLASVSVK